MADTIFKPGYLPDSFDTRDKPYSYRGTAKTPADFQRKDLVTGLPGWSVYNQDTTQSSVASAVALALKFLSIKVPSLKIPSNPSRMFIYYNARALPLLAGAADPTEWPTKLADTGAMIRSALRAVKHLGVVSEDFDPWIIEGRADEVTLDINSYPPALAYKLAAPIASIESCRLDPEHIPEAAAILSADEKLAVKILTLARLKQCLVEGLPVIFAFRLYFATLPEHFVGATADKDEGRSSLKDFKDVRGPADSPAAVVDYGAHVVLAVGFDASECGSRVLVQNSQGDGANSFFWVPFSWILDYEATKDFWVLREVDKSPPSDTIRPLPVPKEPTLPDKWTLKVPLPANGKSVSLTPVSAIASGSRNAKTAELFWVSAEGAVESGNFYEERGWKYKLLKEAHPTCGATGAVAAVARRGGDKNIDVFWVAADGSVHTANKTTDDDNWCYMKIAPCGDRGKPALPGTGVAATSRFKGHAEVFWVGPKGTVEAAYFNPEEKAEWRYYTLEPAENSVAPNGSLTALSMDASNVTVWWVRPDGAVDGRWWWDQGRGKPSDWRPLYQANMLVPDTASLRSRIVAVARPTRSLDVFFVSRRGEICHQVWTEATSWVFGQSVPIQGAFAARVDSGIAVASTRADRMDLFWVSPENALMGSTWDKSRAAGVKWETTVVARNGSVQGGSPLGTVVRDDKSFGVAFRGAWNDQLVVAEYALPTPKEGSGGSGGPPVAKPCSCCSCCSCAPTCGCAPK